MPSGLFYLKALDKSISYIRCVWLVLLLSYFVEISEFYANKVDPDQTSRSAASDLGIHRLPMSLLWDARLKWVNITFPRILDWPWQAKKCLRTGAKYVNLDHPAHRRIIIRVFAPTSPRS